jgi:hypothetical protein
MNKEQMTFEYKKTDNTGMQNQFIHEWGGKKS